MASTSANRDLKRVFAAVGERRGWDFTRVRSARDPVPWDYEEVVRRHLPPTSRVLDIGTGGGERFLALAPSFGAGVGIDFDPGMIRVARENTPASLAAKVSFAVAPADALPFPDASFDAVLCRQAPASVPEVVRLLRPGGVFVTQQVGGRNTQNVFDAFGWGSNGAFLAAWSLADGLPVLTPTYLAEAFRQAGARIVEQDEYDVRYAFLDLASFAFWLTAVPMPEPFDIDRREDQLRAFLDRYETAEGIETNEHRELFVAQLP